MSQIECILLVDDDQIANYLHKSFLNKITTVSTIETANNGEQALSILRSYANGKHCLPEIIFLDINMPVCDGFEFVEAFNNYNFPLKSKIDIVVLTSSANSGDINRMEHLGIKYYLNKPLNKEILSAFFDKRQAAMV
jgi:CheY-like chemotaxis protein